MRKLVIKWKMKLIYVLLLLLLLIVLLSNCTVMNNESNLVGVVDEEVTLIFWHLFTGPDGVVMQNMIDEFNTVYKGQIHVEAEVNSYYEYYDKLLPSIIGSTCPDIAIMHLSQFTRYQSYGLLRSSSHILDAMDLGEEDLVKVLWERGEVNGEHYTIPFDIHFLVLYYNKSLLSENGYNTAPKTGDELMMMAKTIRNENMEDSNKWGMTFEADQSLLFWSILNQLNGKGFDEDEGIPTYNSVEGIQAMELIRDISSEIDHSEGMVHAHSSLEDFKNGKTAFYIDGTWMITELKKVEGFDLGVAYLPVFGSKEAMWADSHNFILPNDGSDDKDEQIQVFIEFIFSRMDEWVEAGHMPALNNVLDIPDDVVHEYMKDFSRYSDNYFIPNSKYFDISWSSLNDAIIGIMTSDITIEKGLDNAYENAILSIQEEIHRRSE